MATIIPMPRWLMLAVVLASNACTTVPADLGRSDVDALVAARGEPLGTDHSSGAIEVLLRQLVTEPLTPDAAVRIALLNNTRLQASYATLGFGAADVYEAGRIRNPIIGAALLRPDEPGDDELRLNLVVSFTDLVTLPARKRLATASFAALKQSIGAEVLAVAAEAESAYYTYVAAKQIAALRAQVAHAGHLSALLAERYHEAGNTSARALVLQRASAAQARLEALDAESDALVARRALADVLGLSIGDAWDAPAALPIPLEEDDDLNGLLSRARELRLDLAAARTQLEVLADRFGVVNRTRWLGELEVGVERERERDGDHITGPAASWEVPIFNRRGDALLRAQADWQIAIGDVQRLAMDVDNEVRLAHAAVGNARARVDVHRIELIPRRIAAVARAQEEVNFMLIGIFELIETKQEEYAAYQGYLEAIRDYWVARVELRRATGGALPGLRASPGERIDVEQLLRAPFEAQNHSKHGSRSPTDGRGHDEHSPHIQPGAVADPQSPVAHSHRGHNGD